VGELAALATATCWAFSTVAFASASQRVGSLVVNVLRLTMAFGFLAAYQAIARGQALPTDATPHALGWLSVSGIVGFFLGDLCLFRAFVVLGPRLTVLVNSTAPAFAALIGWLFLRETLAGKELLGIALTVGGIAWAARDRRTEEGAATGHRAVGVMLALGGALGQAGGLVLSKYGMGEIDAPAATQIRVLAGLAGFVALFFVIRGWPRVTAAVRDRRAMGATAIGTLFGPVLGVTLSLVAVRHTQVGVAASLMATTPILILPLVLLRGERVGARGAVGAVAAVAGVVLLLI